LIMMQTRRRSVDFVSCMPRSRGACSTSYECHQ
jgi:hypothetical protein